MNRTRPPAQADERGKAIRVTVRRLGRCERDRWLETARACPYATYFHTPDWADLMVAIDERFSVATEAFRLVDGTVAVLPLIGYRYGRFFGGFESMVPGVYGGPIAERRLEIDEVDAILDQAVTARTASLRVFGNPYLDACVASPESGAEFTHSFNLRDGFDAVFRRFHRNHRRTYAAAVKAGLVLDRARSLDDYREYYAIYRLDRERWGKNALNDYPFALFAEIHRRGDPNVVLWLARFDGRVIAGDLWLYWNRHNVGWHGAADPSRFDLHPTNFLITEILRDACARGHDWCDLNPSGGRAGVVAFKDSFGVERQYFHHFQRPGSRLFRSRQRLRRFVSLQRRRLDRVIGRKFRGKNFHSG